MLSPFQTRIARLFLSMPEARHFALGGGAALVFKGEITRETQDLDFFVPIQEEVSAAAERFKERLRDEGLSFDVVSSSPAFVRLVVRGEEGQEILVDIGFDFRLREPEQTDIGPVLTTEELAADKMLALFGRAEARDFLDIFFLSARLGTPRLIELARQKDPGFDPHVLAIMIGHFDRLARREFAVDDRTYQEMNSFFRQLRAELIERTLQGDDGPSGKA
ncbi:MAG: nucleotidyl transferase AbiEii/AbiGii toxin family protein [Bacillota bacterium]